MGSISTTQTVVLVTGANQGLGLETIKKLAAEQSNYALLLGSRDIIKGIKAAESITALAGNTIVEPIQLEVTSDDSIAKAVEQVSSKYGRLDVLFNNAGVCWPNEPTPRQEWARIYDVNVTGAALTTEAFVSLLKKAETPRVVFMSSGLGSITDTLKPEWPFYSVISYCLPYCVSKAAMNMLCAGTAVKYAKEGFKCNVIDPGFNSTSLNGFNENGNKNIAEGALEACRIIVQGKDGQYSTYSSKEGIISW